MAFLGEEEEMEVRGARAGGGLGCGGRFRCGRGRRVDHLLLLLLLPHPGLHIINKIIQDSKSYTEYNGFERRLDKKFNSIYFETLCSDGSKPSRNLLLNFVEEHCPRCLTEVEKATCDTSSCNESQSECCQ